MRKAGLPAASFCPLTGNSPPVVSNRARTSEYAGSVMAALFNASQAPVDKCTTMAALFDQLAAVARVVSTDSSSSRPLVLIS